MTADPKIRNTRKKLLSESLDEKGLNKNKLIENISESVIPSMHSTMVNVLNEGIANYNFKKYPGRTSDQKTQNIYKLQEEVNRLRKRNKELEENNYTEVDEIDEPEEINKPTNERINEDIEGTGIFDSIGALISKFAPSIIKGVKAVAPSVLSAAKKVVLNPKNQQDAFNFVKDKLKKKEVVKPSEQEELFDMFKQGKITAQDYKELRGLNTKDVKPIKEIKEVKDDDEHLKNLSGQYTPKKIYLDFDSTSNQEINIQLFDKNGNSVKLEEEPEIKIKDIIKKIYIKWVPLLNEIKSEANND